MASNTTPSYPKKLILKISSSSSSPKLPPRPSESPPPPPSSPLPPPGFTLKSPLVNHGSSSLSPELKLFYDQIFTSLPQTPHLNPLKKFTSENMKQGVKLGWDIAFLNFVKKFRNLVDPTRFLSKVESLTEELEEFGKLGYDVTKVRERFNLLKNRAEQDKTLKEKAEKLEEAKKEKQAEIEEEKFHLMELAEKTTRVANQVKIQESDEEDFE
ncbi:DUF724 domain-containing protein 1-like [Papaver somniferum]|uniref:DUF724 domain-containing protein 1-like n=1 Tax=Papaver somniferum TaxID=3469 RepID=UPI000E6FA9A2|nr:DUF724 domain-containing protein 1-like [Papaver somniferum]